MYVGEKIKIKNVILQHGSTWMAELLGLMVNLEAETQSDLLILTNINFVHLNLHN